jgi:hypothetical protein
MRDILNLLETALALPDIGPPAPPAHPDTSHPTGGDEGRALSGTWINPQIIINLLPGIDDEELFTLAWLKVMRNEEETLTRLEMFQLAKAFISLIRQTDEVKISLIRRLTQINLADDEEVGDFNTIYR